MRAVWMLIVVAWSITCCPLRAVDGSSSPEVISLWPDKVPNATPTQEAERDLSRPNEGLVAGKPVIRLGHVSQPTVTIYRAKLEPTRNAPLVLVCPGGGYHILALDLEGTEVCEWLNQLGIHAALLKYRVPRQERFEPHALPLQDAQRAMSIIRQRAAEWQVDPHKIGVLGFSAGGNLAATLSTSYRERSYPAVDSTDTVSCRPDFTLLIYPAYLIGEKIAADAPATLRLPIDAETPPAFLTMSMDDPVDPRNVLAYASGLHAQKVACEVHLFPKGGHGYGLRRTDAPATHWPDLAAEWLKQFVTAP